MKKCLVVALGLLVSFAARAAMTVDVTIDRAGQPTFIKSCELNIVHTFQEAGFRAELVATEKDGLISIAAKCYEGETLLGEISDFTLVFDEQVLLRQTEEVTVIIVARNTVISEEVVAEEVVAEEVA